MTGGWLPPADPPFGAEEPVEAEGAAGVVAFRPLVTATREGRFVRYAVRVEGMRRLLAYLTEDCCRGSPELCGPAVSAARGVCK